MKKILKSGSFPFCECTGIEPVFSVLPDVLTTRRTLHHDLGSDFRGSLPVPFGFSSPEADQSGRGKTHLHPQLLSVGLTGASVPLVERNPDCVLRPRQGSNLDEHYLHICLCSRRGVRLPIPPRGRVFIPFRNFLLILKMQLSLYSRNN